MKVNYISSFSPTHTRQNAPEQPGIHAAPSLTRLAVLLTLVFVAQISWATTYTVSNTNNSGAGSLRQAITDANANAGADIIDFSVAGTLTLLSGLPSITQALTIDGTTAPGYVAGTPTFIIDGNFTVFTASNPTALTIQGLDVSKSGAQGAIGFNISASSGTVIIQNCKAKNRSTAILCTGNAAWTLTGNDLTTSGLGFQNPALQFSNVTTGTIAASNNLFGGTGANTAMRLVSCSDKIIGDENASPVADILIKDTDGLTNVNSEYVIYTSSCSNLTFDNLDVSKAAGAQNGQGIVMENSTGTMTIKNCKARNRYTGILCHGNAAWTLTDNDLTTSGTGFQNPALQFSNVTTGTIAASNNLFGGTGANTAMRLVSCSDKIIGDENASPAADILIKDTDGLTNINNEYVIYASSCSGLTFDNIDVSKATGAQNGQGIVLENSTGTMIIKNCKARNRHTGILCHGNAAWTLTDNDLTTSGTGFQNPALQFSNVTTGTIAASNNLFGGTGANTAMRLVSCSNKIIGDENASPAADILIKDTDGLTNINNEYVIYASSCSGLTFDNLDVSKATGAQNGQGIVLENSTGTMIIKNCKARNRHTGILCHGNAAWTLTDNDLTTSGTGFQNPALQFSNVTTGTIAASNNLFGGTGANTALRLVSCSDKIIGDENASPAAHIVIKDTDGLTNVNNEYVIYTSSCSGLTFDNLDVSKATGAQNGQGIVLENSTGTMTVKNCKVNNRSTGLNLSGGTTTNTLISCNTITGCTTGISTSGTHTGNSIINNSFLCNAKSIGQSGTALVAQSNFWGGGAPTSGGANGYTGTVDVSNHLTTPPACAPVPEINVQGNGMNIADGDNSPSTADHTDFGTTTGTPITRTFTIQNTGTGSLSLGAGAITLSGGNAALFSVSNVSLPATVAGPNGTLTFDVTYTPGINAGVHTTTVNIANNDCNETPYDFAVKGNLLTCTAPSFTACPNAPVTANTATGQCNAVVTYTVAANGTPAPALTYAFTGATTGSGSGTGSGATFNKGNTIVTVTATNPCGTPICVFMVTVSDMEAPSVTCPANTTVLNTDGGGTCSITIPNYATLLSPTDNCTASGSIAENQSVAAGAHSVSGDGATVTVNYTATDGASPANTTICTVTITVNDDDAPTVTCPPNTTVLNTDGGGTCSITIPNYATLLSPTDNCTASGSIVENQDIAAGSHSVSGDGATVTVNYTATDGASPANTTTCTVTITVNDDDAPSVTCPANTTVINTDGGGTCSITIPNYATLLAPTDNCTASGSIVENQDIAAGAHSVSGDGATVTVNYTATDGASPANTTTCTVTITVNDDDNPSIVCPGNITKNTDPSLCTAIVNYSSPMASDNCGSPTLTRTSAANTASGSAFPLGVTMVNWKAADSSNNSSVCGFTVTVIDNQLPNITCPSNMTRSTDAGLCTAVVTYATPTATDNCGSAMVTRTSAANTASGLAFPKGATTVTWEASDAATPPNIKSCSFIVTVNDGQAPAITCPANQTKSTDAGFCTAVITYAMPTATDNCTPVPTVTIQSGLASGSAFPKGITTVIWKATDGANLTKTCTFRVTVNDSQAPVITCPASQSVNTSGSSCNSAAVTYATPTATDNCMPPAPTVTKVSGPASGSIFPRGSTNVTWRATDGAGNTKTCSFSVTVTDNVLPGITCPGNLAVTAAPGQCSAVASYANPTATDNCGVASLLLLIGSASGAIFPQGVTTNTWRVMDDSGLTNTCSFTVTVSCGTGAQGGNLEERQTVQGSKTRTVSDLVLALAPNPAADQTVISITGLGETGGHLSVHDAQGRLMWRQEVDGSVVGSQQYTVRLEGFAAGLYFVTLRSEEVVMSKRLVVQRI